MKEGEERENVDLPIQNSNWCGQVLLPLSSSSFLPREEPARKLSGLGETGSSRNGRMERNFPDIPIRYSGILGHQMKFWKMSVPFASPPRISGIRSNGKRPRIPCARDVQHLVLSSYPFPTALYGDERGDGKYAFLLH